MSQEGTTKDDPLVMPRYLVTKSVLRNSLRMWLPTVKQVWLADDSAGAGRIGTVISAKKGKVWLSCQRRKNLVIKFQELASEAQQVFRDEVNISTRGTSKQPATQARCPDLGQRTTKISIAAKKILNGKKSFCNSQKWTKATPSRLTLLIQRVTSPNLHSACEKSIHLKTEDYTDPIDHVIHEMLLPTLFSQVEPLPDNLQEVITLPPAKGDLGTFLC